MYIETTKYIHNYLYDFGINCQITKVTKRSIELKAINTDIILVIMDIGLPLPLTITTNNNEQGIENISPRKYNIM